MQVPPFRDLPRVVHALPKEPVEINAAPSEHIPYGPINIKALGNVNEAMTSTRTCGARRRSADTIERSTTGPANCSTPP